MQLYLVHFCISPCSPDTCLPREGWPTWSPGTKRLDEIVSWCLANFTELIQEQKLSWREAMDYEVRGFLHIRGMEMARARLTSLWGSGTKRLFFHHPELLGCNCAAPWDQRLALCSSVYEPFCFRKKLRYVERLRLRAIWIQVTIALLHGAWFLQRFDSLFAYTFQPYFLRVGTSPTRLQPCFFSWWEPQPQVGIRI